MSILNYIAMPLILNVFVWVLNALILDINVLGNVNIMRINVGNSLNKGDAAVWTKKLEMLLPWGFA